MPLHEFACTDCGHVFEEIVSLDASAPECPSCGKPSEKRLSATSSLTGKDKMAYPDARGHGCCGSNPLQKGCTPGSCCGRS